MSARINGVISCEHAASEEEMREAQQMLQNEGTLPPEFHFQPTVEQQPVKVYIGWDARERDAYHVARRSLLKHSSVPVSVCALDRQILQLNGLLRRPVEMMPRGRQMIVKDGRIERRMVAQTGQMWDMISDAPMSTDFAISRFLVPLLAQTGWALFVDCDVVFLDDVAELFQIAAASDQALLCVQHADRAHSGYKMDGQIQTSYARKNWSSVMLFNCDHPKNRGLTLDLINTKPGRDLHRFCWLDDMDIGTLPPEWNWLVNVQERPKQPKLAHFTLGGPWFENWSRQPYDDIWLAASQNC